MAGTFALALFMNRAGADFEAGPTFILGSDPLGVAVADLDGDLDPDLVTVNALHNISVLINAGGGSFASPRNYAAGSEPFALAAADLNGDGKLDLAVAGLSVIRNEGGGVFSRPVMLATEAMPGTFALGDVNGDDDLDIIAVDASQTGSFIVFGNQGTGRFAPGNTFGQKGPTFAMAVSDFE